MSKPIRSGQGHRL